MIKQEHGTRINQRVRLRLDGQDSLYPLACAGSEGWVREQRHDELGYPQVFIEWDKDHWAYNGEPDRWALDAHFEPVEGDVAVSREEDLFKKFMEFMAAQEGTPDLPDQDVDAEYAATLVQAMEEARQADAFMLITVSQKGQQDGYPAYAPAVINYYKDTGSGIILESQISRLASLAHQQLAATVVSDAAERARDHGRES